MFTNKLFVVAGLSLSMLLSACQPVQPMATMKEAAPKLVTIEMTKDGLQVPDEMPSGVVTVIYKNSSDKPASPGIGWMQEGHTIAEMEKALQEGDFITIFKTTVVASNVEVAPGESKESTFLVKAGELFIVNVPDEGAPTSKTSKATTPSTMDAPTADYKAELADFAFIIPDEITAGKHLWEVKNTGKQFHEMSILKLNEGVTVEDLIKLASSQEPPSGPPPFEQIPADTFLGSGATSWVTIDIPAGEYTVVCFLPNTDEEAMSPHAAHGMVRQLKVK